MAFAKRRAVLQHDVDAGFKVVAAEDPANPLTDQQIVEILAGEHLKIARRTVTKYREQEKIPSSRRRKSY